MTEKQLLVYDCIKESINKNGYPPTVREISDMTELSSSTVQFHIKNLEKNGYILRGKTKQRVLGLVSKDVWSLRTTKVENVPVLGAVTTSQSLHSEQNIKDYFPVPTNLLNGIDDRFILTVEDDSMINAVIINKDNILVNSQTTAENGDIVVAFLNDSVIVRRYFKEDNHYRLQPENDSMKPIFVDHVEILGKVIGVFRWSIH